MADPPGTKQSGRPLQEVTPPDVGRADESKGSLVPLEYLGPLIEARVGQMKAEMERDFAGKLARINDLPTKWQLIAGGASAIIVTVGLLFAILSYFGDRQDSSVDRSAELGGTLARIEGKLDDAAEGGEPNANSEQ